MLAITQQSKPIRLWSIMDSTIVTQEEHLICSHQYKGMVLLNSCTLTEESPLWFTTVTEKDKILNPNESILIQDLLYQGWQVLYSMVNTLQDSSLLNMPIYQYLLGFLICDRRNFCLDEFSIIFVKHEANMTSWGWGKIQQQCMGSRNFT